MKRFVWAISDEQCLQLETLDDALTRFQKFDPRSARVVHLRFFGGMTYEEIAEMVGVSTKTVKRDWQLAQSWLRTELAS